VFYSRLLERDREGIEKRIYNPFVMCTYKGHCGDDPEIIRAHAQFRFISKPVLPSHNPLTLLILHFLSVL